MEHIAVAPLPDTRLQFWFSTDQGTLLTTWKTTTDPNAAWTSRGDFLAETGALPGGPVNLAVAPLPDGRLQLWVSTAQGGLFTSWKTTTDPNAAWTGWSDFLAETGALPGGAVNLAVAPLPDRRLQLWVSTAQGGLFTSWKTTTDPNAAWTGWGDFLAETGALPGGAGNLAVAPLPDGRLQLWVSTAQGGLFTSWKTTIDPNAAWTSWSDFLGEALPLSPAMLVSVTPYPVPTNRAVSVAFTSKDATTGSAVAGKVKQNGVVIGNTNTTFLHNFKTTIRRIGPDVEIIFPIVTISAPGYPDMDVDCGFP